MEDAALQPPAACPLRRASLFHYGICMFPVFVGPLIGQWQVHLRRCNQALFQYAKASNLNKAMLHTQPRCSCLKSSAGSRPRRVQMVLFCQALTFIDFNLLLSLKIWWLPVSSLETQQAKKIPRVTIPRSFLFLLVDALSNHLLGRIFLFLPVAPNSGNWSFLEGNFGPGGGMPGRLFWPLLLS